MSQTITIRLSRELAARLAETAAKTGVSQGRIIREQLERARDEDTRPRFMRLAGTVRGRRDLSTRKGFTPP